MTTPILGVGNYVLTSYELPYNAIMKALKDLDIVWMRTFTRLPRRPHPPLTNVAKWPYISDEITWAKNINKLGAAAQRFNRRILLCLHDERTRSEDPVPGIDRATANTFWMPPELQPTFDEALEISDWYISVIQKEYRPYFRIETFNEPPGDGNTWRWATADKKIAAIARDLGYKGAISTNYDVYPPIGKGFVWEHARPKYQTGGWLRRGGNREIEAELKRWQQRWPEATVGLDTDGVAADKIEDLTDLVKRVTGLGGNFLLMTHERMPHQYREDVEIRLIRQMQGAAR